MVYIEEAHAQDEWPISSSRYAEKPVLINQPTTVEERIAVCKTFLSSYNVPESGPNFQVVVDDPSTNNAFSAAYAPWPFRLFGISPSKVITFLPSPHDCEYDVTELREWISSSTS